MDMNYSFQNYIDKYEYYAISIFATVLKPVHRQLDFSYDLNIQ